LLFVFHRLIQFSDAKLQPLHFPFDAIVTDHLPREYLHQTNAMDKALRVPACMAEAMTATVSWASEESGC
jgi:hypothetical protein